jgi:hypothetical protein
VQTWRDDSMGRGVGGGYESRRGDLVELSFAFSTSSPLSSTDTDFSDADGTWLESEARFGVDEICIHPSVMVSRGCDEYSQMSIRSSP